ncbi:hypothetical protein ACFL5Z_15990 [Planctomycetota bacterium]
MASIKLPTEKEIAKLPRLAIVAFAARCARRVQPLFASIWPEVPEKHKKAVTGAIKITEEIAADRRVTADATDAKGVFKTINATDAAYAAVKTAAYAADAAFATDLDTAYVAYTAARAAFYAAYSTNHITCINADFTRLKQAAKKENWTDETPVPPEFFGPLWPDGEPDWKKFITTRKKRRRRKGKKRGSQQGLSIQVVVPDSASEEQVTEELIGLFQSLNEYHIAHDGNGLTIEDFQSFVRDGVLVGVGP